MYCLKKLVNLKTGIEHFRFDTLSDKSLRRPLAPRPPTQWPNQRQRKQVKEPHRAACSASGSLTLDKTGAAPSCSQRCNKSAEQNTKKTQDKTMGATSMGTPLLNNGKLR